MWSYYDWVVVVVVRQLTQYVVVLSLGLLLLSSVSKHNMWSHYDWVVVVVRQLTQYVVVL
jgi:hypothetical protein